MTKVYSLTQGSYDDTYTIFISLSKEKVIEQVKIIVEDLEKRLTGNIGSEYISYRTPELLIEERELDTLYDCNEENPDHGYEKRLDELKELLEKNNEAYWQKERELKGSYLNVVKGTI